MVQMIRESSDRGSRCVVAINMEWVLGILYGKWRRDERQKCISCNWNEEPIPILPIFVLFIVCGWWIGAIFALWILFFN